MDISKLETLIKEAEYALQQTVEYQRVEELKRELSQTIEQDRKKEFLLGIQEEIKNKGYELRTGHGVSNGKGFTHLIVPINTSKINQVIISDYEESRLELVNGTSIDFSNVLGFGNNEEITWLVAYSLLKGRSLSGILELYEGESYYD